MTAMPMRFARISCLLLLATAGACEGPPPWATDDEEPTQPAREDFGPVAAYDRLLLFVGPGEAVPMAAVFDFAALSDSTGFRRGIRARLLTDSEWLPLQDAAWQMEPMREPWRLVPYGPLKVVVGDEGELDALVYRNDPPVRLDPGSSLAEYTPDGGTQLVLRQGSLRIDDEMFAGIILDSQHGRALRNGARRTDASPPEAEGDPDLDQDTAGVEEADDTAATESDQEAGAGEENGEPSPTARPGVEALLLDNSGYYVVFAPATNGDLAWLRLGAQDEVRRGTRLEATEWEEEPDAGVQVPVRWQVASPDGVLAGDVRALSADHSTLSGRADVGALSYVVVSGWIQDREVRREVYGLIRHVR